MDIKSEIAKIAEAYCVQNQLPINRRFTDADLEHTFDLLADSKRLAERIEGEARAVGFLPPELEKCPQCGSRECGPIRCRFTMNDHARRHVGEPI